MGLKATAEKQQLPSPSTTYFCMLQYSRICNSLIAWLCSSLVEVSLWKYSDGTPDIKGIMWYENIGEFPTIRHILLAKSAEDTVFLTMRSMSKIEIVDSPSSVISSASLLSLELISSHSFLQVVLIRSLWCTLFMFAAFFSSANEHESELPFLQLCLYKRIVIKAYANGRENDRWLDTMNGRTRL